MCELTVYYQFFKDWDKNGSLTWSVSNNKFSLLYYYNDNNIDLKKKLNRLILLQINPNHQKKVGNYLFVWKNITLKNGIMILQKRLSFL